MFHFSRRSLPLTVLPLVLAALSLASPGARAQNGGGDKGKDEPPFHEYKGVHIGMTTDEARKLLGNPADKGDTQDFYSFNDNETAQLFYDASTHKVTAIAVNFMGDVSKAPTAKAILGTDIEAKPDGSMHKKVDYPKAGYWVAYSRTAGDSPLVTITIQKQQ